MLIRNWFRPNRKNNIIIGENANSSDFMIEPEITGHAIVFGAHGSGKTDRFVIPNVKEIGKRGESVIVASCGDRVYKEAAAEFKAKGYEVRVLNLQNPHLSDKWDVFGDLKPDNAGDTQHFIDTATSIAKAFMTGSGVEVHCDAEERITTELLLESIFVRVCGDPNMDDRANTICDIAQGKNVSKDFYDNLFTSAGAEGYEHLAEDLYRTYKTLSSDEMSSKKIKAKAAAATKVLSAPNIRQITSTRVDAASNRKVIDLSAFETKPCAIFVVTSPRDRNAEMFSAIFFSRLIYTLCHTKSLNNPVTIMIDDAECVERIHALGNTILHTNPNTIRFCTIWSNVGQLQRIYCDEFEWERIMGSCATKIGFGFADLDTAQVFQKLSQNLSERAIMTANRGTCFVSTKHGNEFSVVAPA